MTELVWLNGEILPLTEATLSIEDRGYQFADGVYEVVRVYGGVPFTLTQHLARLEKSAAGIRMGLPMPPDAIGREVVRLIQRSGLVEGMIYLQLTRGASPRNHAFPRDAKPTLLFYTRSLPPVDRPGQGAGAKLLPVADERWKRCWIKAIALLPNVLAKNEALDGGYDEAVFVEEGVVSECSASNVYAVIGGQVFTHPVGTKVLPGITRQVLLDVAVRAGVTVLETPFTADQAASADELFITSTTREIAWVSHWGTRQIGTGTCGPITRTLHEAIRREVERETGRAASAA